VASEFLPIALSQYESQIIIDQFVGIVVESLMEEEVACFHQSGLLAWVVIIINTLSEIAVGSDFDIERLNR
jgi:hypothetical protein